MDEKPMTVGDLRALLDEHPDDMEILNTRHSDYDYVRASDWSVVEGVPQDWGVMRNHPTMSPENKARAKKFLHLEGN